LIFVVELRKHAELSASEVEEIEGWQIYEYEDKEKPELCMYLLCSKNEVCVLREKNAFCIEKDQLNTESLQQLLSQTVVSKEEILGENDVIADNDVKKTNLGSGENIRKLWKEFLQQTNQKMHHKKKNYVHKAKHDESFEATSAPPTDEPLVDRHDIEPTQADKECTHDELNAIGERMMKWFKDIHQQEPSADFRLPHHHISCLPEVGWMFGRLDGDQSASLTPQELWSIEHDQYEPCLRQFIDRCDQNADQDISADEWCDCFQYADHARDEPPCHKARHAIDPHLMGAYMPRCDVDGYYRPAQCHEEICWCADRWGREFPGSKVRASKPDCGQYDEKDDGEDTEL